MRYLNLGDCCPQLTDLTLICISSSCRNMNSLVLHNCILVTDIGLEFLASKNNHILPSGCEWLHTLDIKSCGQVSDVGVKALSIGCRRLTSVNIRHCLNITEQGVSALVSRCLELSDLKMSFGGGILSGY
jgi:hypothetical protein